MDVPAVYLVTVNSLTESGVQLAFPEVLGVVTSQSSPEAAIAWTCANEAIIVRDVTVEILCVGEQCWYVEGPESYQ